MRILPVNFNQNRNNNNRNTSFGIYISEDFDQILGRQIPRVSSKTFASKCQKLAEFSKRIQKLAAKQDNLCAYLREGIEETTGKKKFVLALSDIMKHTRQLRPFDTINQVLSFMERKEIYNIMDKSTLPNGDDKALLAFEDKYFGPKYIAWQRQQMV